MRGKLKQEQDDSYAKTICEWMLFYQSLLNLNLVFTPVFSTRFKFTTALHFMTCINLISTEMVTKLKNESCIAYRSHLYNDRRVYICYSFCHKFPSSSHNAFYLITHALSSLNLLPN